MKQLQFITHQTERFTPFEGAKAALAGGCRWIQLRMKDTGKEELLHTARRLRALCDSYQAVLIIDDHVDVALQSGADGVHLGKADMDPVAAREILGSQKIIGGTANTIEDIRELVAKNVNYIGLGPFRFTETKKNLSALLGIEGYRRIFEECRREGIELPVVAIGGITDRDIPEILSAGASGIALSSMILAAQDPVAETRRLLEILS